MFAPFTNRNIMAANFNEIRFFKGRINCYWVSFNWVFGARIFQVCKAHFEAIGLLKRELIAAGKARAEWGIWTRGMPPQQGLSPSTSKMKSW